MRLSANPTLAYESLTRSVSLNVKERPAIHADART